LDIVSPDRSEHLALVDILQQAIDPDGRISAAIQALAPLEGKILLEVGAGTGDRSLQYARMAKHVYAFEPEPRPFSMLRGRIKSAGLTNVTPLRGNADALELDDQTVDVTYATWSAILRPGAVAELREVERVTRPGGRIIVVQNYGHDELSQLWSAAEGECEEWPTWYEERGFARHVVQTAWRFQRPDEARVVLGALWGPGAQNRVPLRGTVEFRYQVAVYHKQVGGRMSPG
jgi:ubiquinone/menaquinone biosynthesis C-methylase UbiE